MDVVIAARSQRIRARHACERATSLCDEARSLRGASERVTTAILSELEAFPTPAVAGARGRPFGLRLVRLPVCVGFARRQLGQWLARVGVDGVAARDISLAFTEACANAVEHPVAPTRQVFEVFGSVTSNDVAIRVRDYGSWSRRTASEEHGRGLALIHSLMDGVDLERGTGGTAVKMWKLRPDGQLSPSTSKRT